MKGNLHALILAGGGGTRLWPLSRRARPKQLLGAFSPGGRPLIAETVARLAPLVPPSRTWVVAGTPHQAALCEALPELPPDHLIIEPEPRNTAPAIGLGCATIAATDPHAIVAVLPSDHAIGKPERFRALLAAAATLASEQHLLVTLGVVPDRPATGYGWLERGESLGRVLAAEAFRVKRFVEKPDAAKALEMLKAGGFAWNSGMFVWRVADLLEELGRFLPPVGRGLAEMTAAPPPERAARTEALFAAAPSISIDYAVMEKSERVAMLPADIGWDDIGTFRSLAGVHPDGRGGSANARELVAIDSQANLIHAPEKTVALVGVEDLVIVDTPDALLVTRRDRAEEVKKVVEELARRKREDLL